MLCVCAECLTVKISVLLKSDRSFCSYLLVSSECIGRSGAKNDRAREAGSINQVSNSNSKFCDALQQYLVGAYVSVCEFIYVRGCMPMILHGHQEFCNSNVCMFNLLLHLKLSYLWPHLCCPFLVKCMYG